MTRTENDRPAIRAMYAGLVFTLVATIVPYVDRADLAGHIRAGYPTYSRSRIDDAVSIYLIYLSLIGALGVGCWLATIRAVRAGKPWARRLATAIFAVAATVALTDLLIRDTSGKTGLPPLLGWIGMLPCLAGLLALGLLSSRWSRRG